MSTFSLVLLVVGVFLVLYAALSLTRRGPSHARERIGCGFMLLAGLVWGIALARYLGDSWAGIRLGMAFAFVLPALAALTNPVRGRFISAVVLLSFAVILGATAAPKLWRKLRPPAAESTVSEVEATIDELSRRIEETRGHIERLERDREDLRSRLRGFGYADFDSLAADDAAYAVLVEYAEVLAMIDRAESAIAQYSDSLERLRSALRRIRRVAGSEPAVGRETAEGEIRDILQQTEHERVDLGPATVQEHVERERLREVFEDQM